MKERAPAPVVLFVYKRPQHTRATLVALAANLLARETDVFIYCDGPKGPADAAAVAYTRDIARGATGFNSVTLIERDANIGLARSVIAGVTEMLARFDRVIVLEDDLLTSQHFLTYMNQALAHYEADPKAFSVTGHTFPAGVLDIPPTYAFDTYASYRCSSWSWGTWRDRWQRIDWGMDYFPSFMQDAGQQSLFNRGGEDLTPTLALQYEGKRDSWAIRFCFAHALYGMRCIYPIRTLVRNIGLDNSGTHTGRDSRFIHTRIDNDWQPRAFCSASDVDATISERFRNIFASVAPSFSDRVANKARGAVRRAREAVEPVLDRLMAPDGPQADKTDLLMVNTLQTSGGAARAAYRCFTGMRQVFPNARYLSLFADCTGDNHDGLSASGFRALMTRKSTLLDRLPLLLYPKRHRDLFSPGFWANPGRLRVTRYDAKIVHLHRVAGGMLDMNDIAALCAPVVWTLHDQWPFTGGCHYAGACERFEAQCGRCPQLASENDNDITNALWLKKSDAFGKSDITVVAPSHWMAGLAKRSSLFADKRVEVIPNGLDTDVFRPIGRDEARKALKIETTLPVILFGAPLVSELRKGGDLLAEVIKIIDFPCVVAMFGLGELAFEGKAGITVHHLGEIADDEMMARVYSAADVFVCPSRIDNLPNTVAEALACGLPCVAFDVGGLPDMINHKINGWLATPYKPDDLLGGITWVLQHQFGQALRKSARAKALAEYSIPVMSARYKHLYEELLALRPAHAKSDLRC